MVKRQGSEILRNPSLLFASAFVFSAIAHAQEPPPLQPRTPTGFSTIAQDYVYAPPDEGSFPSLCVWVVGRRES